MIPAWLEAAVGDVWRSARLRRCARCQAPILAGLDATMAAVAVRADPTPLTPLGEAAALLGGRATFDLSDVAGRKELTYRYCDQISGLRRYPVLAAHECGKSLHLFAEKRPVRSRYVIPAEPPF
jgi:hypothetical protein